jgi:hypothetical protein
MRCVRTLLAVSCEFRLRADCMLAVLLNFRRTRSSIIGVEEKVGPSKNRRHQIVTVQRRQGGTDFVLPVFQIVKECFGVVLARVGGLLQWFKLFMESNDFSIQANT